MNINYNEFNNIYYSAVRNLYGIRDNYESNISNNRFNNCNRGINIINLAGSATFLARHNFNNNFYNFNSLTVPLAPINYLNKQQFFSIENVPSLFPTEFYTNNNIVNGAHIGFYLSNVSGNSTSPGIFNATINNNTVNLQGYTQNPANAEYGALIRNSKNISIEQNQILGTTSSNLVQRGISVETSAGYLEFKSNNVLSLGTGIRIYNNSPDLGFFCNLMDNDFRGIQNDASNVGQQGNATNTSDNQWSNNIDFDEFADGGFTQSNWHLRNSPSNYSPTLRPNLGNQFIFIQGVTTSVTPNCSNPCPPPSGCRIDYFNYKISQIDTATNLTNEQKYNSQATIYAQLELEMPDSVLLNDAVVVQFKDSMDNSNAKKISQIHQKIIDNEFVEATTINTALSPQNNSEWNSKIFNEIYLSTWAIDNFDLSDYQISILNDIAHQNPLNGGVAVYYARVMLDLQLDDELDEGGGSRFGIHNNNLTTLIKSSKLICSIIENPTSNLVKIKCNSSIQNCEQAILINSNGQIVNKWIKPDVNQDQVSLKISNLATGLYQVVLITNTQTYTGKVVIQNE
jgi:hypothetical protein